MRISTNITNRDELAKAHQALKDAELLLSSLWRDAHLDRRIMDRARRLERRIGELERAIGMAEGTVAETEYRTRIAREE
jgi:hypothetical protein